MCFFALSGIENHPTPALRDAGQHQGMKDLQGDEISAEQFKIPWLPMETL